MRTFLLLLIISASTLFTNSNANELLQESKKRSNLFEKKMQLPKETMHEIKSGWGGSWSINAGTLFFQKRIIENYRNEVNHQMFKPLFNFESTSVVDSVITTKVNGDKGKYTYTYDSNGNLISVYRKLWVSNQWMLIERFIYSYDAYGNKISDLYEGWAGNQWMNNQQVTYTYDSNRNLTSELFEVWSGSQWSTTERFTYTYNSNGNRILALYEGWAGSQWVNNQKYTYTYDSNGNMTSSLWERWEGSQWVNMNHGIYTYDSNGNRTSHQSENWDGTQWVKISNRTYEHDSNGNTTTSLYEIWNGSQWVIFSRYTYTYDSNGNMTLDLYEGWDGSQWVNYLRTPYTFDSNGNMILASYEYWDGEQWIETDGFLSFYLGSEFYYYMAANINVYYSSVSNVLIDKGIVTDYSLSQNYPNPFNPSTMVKYGIPEQSNIRIEVFNMLGQRVGVLVNGNKSAGYYETTWDASNLPSGLYLISLRAEGVNSKKNFTQVKKALLLK